MSIHTKSLLVSAVLSAAAAVSAPAAVISFIATGTNAGGNPINLEADIVLGTDTATIVLRNLNTDTTTVAQNIYGFTFEPTPLPAATGLALTGTCTTRDITGPTTWTDLTGQDPAWTYAVSGGAYTLSTAPNPELTIIGDNTSGSYSGGSIVGNGPHNPFILQEATFTFTIPGLTADTDISAASFLIGTAGERVPGTKVHEGDVPEPASLALLAAGAALLLGRRRYAR
jgi:hypothetical protein